ncbi:MAG: phasin family protein [Proteobacteria bacterium]|nr:phasin family protein [Pseudomonadota bacterium]
MTDKVTKKTGPAKAPAAKAAAPKPVAAPAPVAAAPKTAAPAPKPVAKVAEPKQVVAAASKPVAPVAKAVEPKPAVAAAAPMAPAPQPEVKPEPKQETAAIRPIETMKGPTMTDTTTKTVDAAKTFAKDAQAKATELFNDFNTRTKAAVERSTKLAEEFNEFNKGNIEALVESGRVAAKAAETIGQQAAETARKNFEQTTAALKSFASAKTPTEFFQLQSDYARTAFDALIADASKNSETFLKLAGDVFQPISNRFAVAAEKIKVAA